MRRPPMDRARPLQSLRALGGQGRVGRDIPCPGFGGRPAGRGADRLHGSPGASLRVRRKRGERSQAIGRSRGGRTTKIHALTDAFCRPVAFLLTGGQVADYTAADALLERMPATAILHGDKGYDSDALRRKIEAFDLLPVSWTPR